MNNILPIGSIVKLKNGERKLMIINRAPLYNNEGTLGYFEYSACLYPNGHVDQNVFFFNEENIEEVLFEGFCDEEEEEFQIAYEEQVKKTPYPKLRLERKEV
ncbi:MAG: DUF4176 domain-containing protein [Lachnospiraceae bacterium]